MAKYNDMTIGQGKVVFETILTFLRTVQITAQSAVTTSKKYFEDAGVKWAGSNFENQFYGLQIPGVEEAELAVKKLKESSLDTSIMAELGDKTEISVSQFRAFLAENRENKEWFIFYLRGKDGNLLAVHASWGVVRRGWSVGAHSVVDPGGWDDGDRVVSRN